MKLAPHRLQPALVSVTERWLLLLPLAALLLWLSGGIVLEWVAGLATAALVLAALLPTWQQALARTGAGLLLASLATLAVLLLRDDFSFRYVQLYSSAALAWPFKLANIWGGEEGTLLLLASLLAWLATGLIKYSGWAGPGVLLIAACFSLAAVFWTPFDPLPATDSGEQIGRGLNAHLLSVWMTLHPPLVLVAYALILAPFGAALEALVKGTGEWALIARRYNRTGWLILSAGLAAGMAWAYEDFSFGQFWHWDPVQTAIFVVWALSTAQMHGLRVYRRDGPFARTLPLLGGAAAISALVAMTVTRSTTLASSHSYVGDTSSPALIVMTMTLALCLLFGLLLSRKRKIRKHRGGEMRWLLWAAVLLLTTAAGIGLLSLGHAYVSSWQGLPRPDSLKPFFETLSRWTTTSELQELRQVFSQWDVDNFALNRWLALVAALVGLLGGHAFLRLRWPALAWAVTGIAAVLALLVAWLLQPLTRHYTGTGLTSQSTVANFFWLDVLAVTATYLGLSALVWALRTARRLSLRTLLTFTGPVALVHFGIMLALLGALSASVLDSHAQRVLSWPQDANRLHKFADGYQLSIDIQPKLAADDGVRSLDGSGGFRNLATVHLFEQAQEQLNQIGNGNALYRDDRDPLEGYSGPVRQLCRILDYRYARYADGPARMLDPFIKRGLWQDLQVWIPPLDYEAARNDSNTHDMVVVIKRFPLMTAIWLGLTLTLIGAAILTLAGWFPQLAIPKKN